MKHIELPSGGVARVSDDIKPETVAALDEIVQAAQSLGEKFPDGCEAVYRGSPVRVVRRTARRMHGNETVVIKNLRSNQSYPVAAKYLLTEAEWEAKQRKINEGDCATEDPLGREKG
jgi:hypothetical protein